jgi:hypothetical protein
MVGYVGSDQDGNPLPPEVYELQPISYLNDAKKLQSANLGLSGVKGTSWNPQGQPVTVGDKVYELVTDYAKFPGLVFYKEVTHSNPQPEPHKVPDSTTTTIGVVAAMAVAAAAAAAAYGGGPAASGGIGINDMTSQHFWKNVTDRRISLARHRSLLRVIV